MWFVKVPNVGLQVQSPCSPCALSLRSEADRRDSYCASASDAPARLLQEGVAARAVNVAELLGLPASDADWVRVWPQEPSGQQVLAFDVADASNPLHAVADIR